MLSNIWLSTLEKSSRDPKPNISRSEATLKSHCGLQGLNSQRQAVDRVDAASCWATRLQTPDPAYASATPIRPERIPAIRLTLVVVLKLICLVRIVPWIRPKELMTSVSESARNRLVSAGCW